MVQTKLGAERNPWVEYMKLCSEYYKSGHRTPPPIRRENDEQKPVNPSLGEDNNEEEERMPQDAKDVTDAIKPRVPGCECIAECTYDNAKYIWKRLQDQFPEVGRNPSYFKFPGQGQHL